MKTLTYTNTDNAVKSNKANIVPYISVLEAAIMSEYFMLWRSFLLAFSHVPGKKNRKIAGCAQCSPIDITLEELWPLPMFHSSNA
jgi:hypothetical protein